MYWEPQWLRSLRMAISCLYDTLHLMKDIGSRTFFSVFFSLSDETVIDGHQSYPLLTNIRTVGNAVFFLGIVLIIGIGILERRRRNNNKNRKGEMHQNKWSLAIQSTRPQVRSKRRRPRLHEQKHPKRQHQQERSGPAIPPPTPFGGGGAGGINGGSRSRLNTGEHFAADVFGGGAGTAGREISDATAATTITTTTTATPRWERAMMAASVTSHHPDGPTSSSHVSHLVARRTAGVVGKDDDDFDDHAGGISDYYYLYQNNARIRHLRKTHYFGPCRNRITYKTWTPPPSWTDASRHVLPRDCNLPLERNVELCLATATSTIDIHPPKSNTRHHHATPPMITQQQQQVRDRKQTDGKNTPKKETALILPVNEMSLQVEHADGGVLNLYVKESTRDEWMEHTFASAHEAAQFQCDLLALQLFGESIHNMYQALRIVHQGSLACPAKEYVLHDSGLPGGGGDSSDSNKKNDNGDGKDGGGASGDSDTNFEELATGIAWDDVMRCLGGAFPSIRLKLETILWLKKAADSATSPATTNRSMKSGKNSKAVTDDHNLDDKIMQQANLSSLREDYISKRLLLGPIDFFRLFVSRLPETSVPQCYSSRSRVEKFLVWSKRVARATVLVQAYAKARIVVNRGWTLHRPMPEKYWKQRLAFDDALDNMKWDHSAENEYYEGTVSRDVICQVRGLDSLRKRPWWSLDRPAPVMSLIQGYCLVGVHSFRVKDINNSPFRPGTDPVLALPSLRKLVEDNPGLDFFITAFGMVDRELYNVGVFVRTLPKGIDTHFDNVVDNYVNGDVALREKKLELLVQLGVHHESLTWMTYIVISIIYFLSRFNFGDNAPPSQTSSTTDRTQLPALPLASCGDNFHFGGALQPEDSVLPTNYVSHSLYIDSQKNLSLAVRLMLWYFFRGGIRREVFDFTFVLAGHEIKELPERALCSMRFVHAMAKEFALSTGYLMPHTKKARQSSQHHDDVEGTSTAYLKKYVSDPFLWTVTPVIHAVKGGAERRNTEAQIKAFIKSRDPSRNDTWAQVMVTSDAFEEAVNELVRILENVEVPLRISAGGSQTTVSAFAEGDIAKVPILSRVSRGDILRHFIASGCSHKKAAVRLVETAAWHGLTFPMDTQVFRLELQNGQFFQQGIDKRGFPVVYFRNMLLGPWRQDEDAVIAAVLHRLEQCIQFHREDWPDIQCTLVVMMGRPHKRRKKKKEVDTKDDGDNKDGSQTPGNKDGAGSKNSGDEISEDEEEDAEVDDDGHDWDVKKLGLVNNPRIDPKEKWQVHTSKNMILRLINILLDYYPERLNRAYVVVGHGNKAYAKTLVGSMLELSNYVASSRTREKVKFLYRYSDLRDYIDKDQLVTIASGRAPLSPAAFECA